MLLELKEKQGTEKALAKDGIIFKEDVIEMVSAYRERTKNLTDPLKYAHFSVIEVIKLLISHKAIDQKALNLIKYNSATNNPFGLKIYIGNHTKEDNCPEGRLDYVDKDTTIVCVTEIVNTKEYLYRDLLGPGDKVCVSTTARDPEGGALDQSSTYPPDNPYDLTNPPVPQPEPANAYDVGYPEKE